MCVCSPLPCKICLFVDALIQNQTRTQIFNLNTRDRLYRGTSEGKTECSTPIRSERFWQNGKSPFKFRSTHSNTRIAGDAIDDVCAFFFFHKSMVRFQGDSNTNKQNKYSVIFGNRYTTYTADVLSSGPDPYSYDFSDYFNIQNN